MIAARSQRRLRWGSGIGPWPAHSVARLAHALGGEAGGFGGPGHQRRAFVDLLLALLGDAEGDRRDVVAPAAAVGRVDQLADRASEAARADEDVAHLGLGDHRRQAVAAEQEDVAGLGREGHGVHLHLGLGAEGAGDDRALRVLLGLLLGEAALAAQLLDQGVVLGEALQLAVAQHVGAAVADVAERDLAVAKEGSRERGSHTRPARVALGEVVDLAVGGEGDALELGLGGVVVERAALEGPRGDPRGDLTGLGAAHPVRDREDGRAREVGVLVGVPLAARVGLVGLLGDHQRHGQLTSNVNSVSPILILSPGRSSASPCRSAELRRVPLVEPMSST